MSTDRQLKRPLTPALSPVNGGEGTAQRYIPSPPGSGEADFSASARSWPTRADRPDEGVAARGVTLIEVLMSLMIMSIGISAVAVLFPISVLRSVQATQMTNGAILKYMAEAIVQMQPRLVFDPDGDGNLDEHIMNQVESRYIIDPSGYFEIAATGTYSISPTLDGNNNGSLPNDSALRGLADWFGNLDADGNGIPEPFTALPRYDGGLRSATRNATYTYGYAPSGGDPEEARALRFLGSNLSRLGDGWETQLDTLAVDFVLAGGSLAGGTAAAGAQIIGLKLPDDVDLSSVPTSSNMVPVASGTQLIPDPEVCRIIVFSFDGNFSVSFPLIAVDDATKFAVWAEIGADLNMNGVPDVRTLPLQFVNPVTGNFEISRVVLQSAKTHDYNWLLTVRRGQDGQARGVDIVVTYNKSITADEERLFAASFNTSVLAPNSPYIIQVLAASGLKENGEPAEPLLKKSGFVLDVTNARWYRIRDYMEGVVTVGGTTGPGYFVTLETPVIQNALPGFAMFLPGVIDVYPMGSVPIP